MDLVKLLFTLFPVALVAGVVYFIAKSNRRQRIAVALTLVFPGLGHFWLGHRPRAYVFAVVIVPLFLAGMVLADFRNVSPDRHPIWALAQIPGGLLSVIAWIATRTLHLARDNPYYPIGCLYTGAACLLNVVTSCDVWDLAGPRKAGSEAEPVAP